MSGPGFRRTLPAGGVLWWEGDPAASLALVDRGSLGVRASGRWIDAALPGTVLGEAALLTTTDGAAGRRTADVVALGPDTVAVEHPIDGLHEPAGESVRAAVLRTLFYQAARNVLLVRAARPGDALIGAATQGLIEAAGRAYPHVGAVPAGDDFLAAFRFAYRWRESSDAMRRELAPAATWTPERARAALDEIRSTGLISEIASEIEGFVALWASLPRSD